MTRLLASPRFRFLTVVAVLSFAAFAENRQPGCQIENEANAHGGDNAATLPEFRFDAKTPPMFMLHGDRDYYSPMASVLLYTELHRRKIPAQLFVFANVNHGLGDTVNAKGWQGRIVDWMESIGF